LYCKSNIFAEALWTAEAGQGLPYEAGQGDSDPPRAISGGFAKIPYGRTERSADFFTAPIDANVHFRRIALGTLRKRNRKAISLAASSFRLTHPIPGLKARAEAFVFEVNRLRWRLYESVRCSWGLCALGLPKSFVQ